MWVAFSITDEPAENATVEVSVVDENDSYAGVGTYTTDENGTVTLPASETTTSLRLHVTASDLEKNHTIMILNASATGDAFGAQVSAHVHSLLGSYDGGIGRMVAEFVTSHNPGNAPDHAGPPEDVGPPNAAGSQGGNSTASQGGPEKGGGPPDHASQGDGHPGNGKAKGR